MRPTTHGRPPWQRKTSPVRPDMSVEMAFYSVNGDSSYAA